MRPELDAELRAVVRRLDADEDARGCSASFSGARCHLRAGHAGPHWVMFEDGSTLTFGPGA